MEQYPETGIYIHIPFCVKKCGYCDFLSTPTGKETQHKYVNALLKEMEYYKKKLKNYKIRTIYIGGGTPSILEGVEMQRILAALKKIGRNQEMLEQGQITDFWEEATIEVNPGTVTEEKLTIYLQGRINRLSMGLQSSDNEELKLLGRIHTFEEFTKNYKLARKVGFKNISIDLMSALPGQTLEKWKQSLYHTIELEPEHISAYSLIIEENTLFEKLYGENGEKKDLLPSEEVEREMYEITGKILKKAGYQRYEISNYAKNGKESKHNSSYWQGIDYIGMGLGASSCFQNERYHNIDDLNEYIRNLAHGKNVIEEREKQTKKSKMEEFMFLGLRMTKGISKQLFYKKFSVRLYDIYGNIIQKFMKEGLLLEEGDRLFLSDKGIDISNWIFSEFLLEEENESVQKQR